MALPAEHGRDRPQDDPHVEPDRPAVDVLEVGLDPSIEVRLATRRRPARARSSPAASTGAGDARRRSAPTSAGNGGRGPTRLISPRRTLSSWGSSSSDVRRSHRPARVDPRVGRHLEGVAPDLVLVEEVLELLLGVRRPSSGTSTTSKGRPCRPTRCWRNRIGPRESSLIQTAIANMTGARTTASSRLPTKSRARLDEQADDAVGARQEGVDRDTVELLRLARRDRVAEEVHRDRARSCPPPRTGGRGRRSATTRRMARQIATSSTTLAVEDVLDLIEGPERRPGDGRWRVSLLAEVSDDLAGRASGEPRRGRRTPGSAASCRG